jgi:glycosyltransferase involved in cell wall biosynthesis
MIRFPQGGMITHGLNYLLGLSRSGHEVYFIENAGYSNSCFDPVRQTMSDDCTYGIQAVRVVFERFGFQNRWCFVDINGVHYGLSRQELSSILDSADVYVNMSPEGDWNEASIRCRRRVLLDMEPGFQQIRMMRRQQAGEPVPPYDYYFTLAQNIGTPKSTVPVGAEQWRGYAIPVALDLFPVTSAPGDGAYTTVMNWQAIQPIEFDGAVYGNKDLEFKKFERLPQLVEVPCELAVTGLHAPVALLEAGGWRVRKAEDIAKSLDSYAGYIQGSRGEFSVCKHAFVAMNTGWFGDREAAYLASGRPVVLQDCGWSEHFPCGEGLFAVDDVEEAADAIRRIESDYALHSKRAREVAEEYLDATKVMGKLIEQVI